MKTRKTIFITGSILGLSFLISGMGIKNQGSNNHLNGSIEYLEEQSSQEFDTYALNMNPEDFIQTEFPVIKNLDEIEYIETEEDIVIDLDELEFDTYELEINPEDFIQTEFPVIENLDEIEYIKI